MKTVLTLTLLLSSTAFAVEEGRESSEVLLKRCIEGEKILNGGSTSKWTDAYRCSSYMEGFADGMAAVNGQQAACIPRDVTTGQLIRVVLKYLRENPSKLHLDQAEGVKAALRSAYPCR